MEFKLDNAHTFFTSKQHYLAFREQFRASARNAMQHDAKPLRATHFLLFALLSGRDATEAFAPKFRGLPPYVTPYRALREAWTNIARAVHFPEHASGWVLEPFGDTVTPQMLDRLVREMTWDGNIRWPSATTVLAEELAKVSSFLCRHQKQLEPEAAKILYENIWELYT